MLGGGPICSNRAMRMHQKNHHQQLTQPIIIAG